MEHVDNLSVAGIGRPTTTLASSESPDNAEESSGCELAATAPFAEKADGRELRLFRTLAAVA